MSKTKPKMTMSQKSASLSNIPCSLRECTPPGRLLHPIVRPKMCKREILLLPPAGEEGGTLNCAPSAVADAGNGGTLNCAPSAVAPRGMRGEAQLGRSTGLHPHPDPPPSQGEGTRWPACYPDSRCYSRSPAVAQGGYHVGRTGDARMK